MTQVQQALETLERAGFFAGEHLSLSAAAARLDCSVRWVRDHLDQFPNAWRMPGGELRIPRRDIEDLAANSKLRRAA